MSSAEDVYRKAPVWLQTILLNAYAWRIGRHRYGARYREALAGMRERERWSPERLREWQGERLRHVVRVAWEHTRFYRERMQARGVGPDDIRGLDDLPKLPLLTKQDVRERGSELMTRATPARGWLHGHTSGTTGSPLGIWYDRDLCAINNAVDARQKTWGGMGEHDWIGLLLGRVVVPPEQTTPPFWRRNHVQRQIWFSSFHMSDANLRAYVDEIRGRGLRFLDGYPSTLFILAQHLLRRGERLPLAAVFTSSETLHAVQREAIESAFACRIFDYYGLAERVIFASECEVHAGKHLAEDFGATEVVDADGNPVAEGEIGHLVGTSLHNVAMPMLRYRTTDLTAIVPGTCACGRPFRRIRDVTTKAEDIVVTPDGRMISPSILTHPFKPFDQILKSQIVQESPERLLVKLVPSERFGDDDREKLVTGLRERLGDAVTIEVEQVDDIPRDASGKFRWVISRVPHSERLDWRQVAGADAQRAAGERSSSS